MSTSFARALSPSIAATFLASRDSSDHSERTARHIAVLACNSFEELVGMVHSDYRDTLRPLLSEVTSNATKRISKKATLSKLKLGRASSPIKFPSHLQAKAPEVQMTKEFAAAEAGRKIASDLK